MKLSIRCRLALLGPFWLLMLASSAPVYAEAGRWVASWAAAPQSVSDNPAAPAFNRAPQINHQTVRQIVYSALAGEQLRIQISNRYGRTPLVLAGVHLARSMSFAATEAGSDRTVTFSGRAAVSIPPGQTWQSDPVSLSVRAGAPLAISLYISGAQSPSTWHKLASQVNYLSVPGEHLSDTTGAAFRGRFTSYLWLSGVSVAAGEHASAYSMAAIGDSITDGMRSTLNANRRWPDQLNRRIPASTVAVINLGISGGRLLSDSSCYGESLERRFERDAVQADGVRAALVLIGINDINFAAMPPHAGLDCDTPHTKVTAPMLIDGYRHLIEVAHAHGLRIFGATITPASLPPEREALRLAVNRWIRSGGGFDGVVDFDAALRNPAQVDELLPRFDSGDHVHPSDAGYAQMAAAVPLELLEAAPVHAVRPAP